MNVMLYKLPTLSEILNHELFSYGDKVHFTILSLLTIIFVLLIAKLLLWMFWKGLKRYGTQKKIDTGRQYGLYQIVKYSVYFIAVIIILDSQNVGLSSILISSGALLVGVGIGLQQIFRDFFSGVTLLFDGAIKVNDKLVVDDMICKVKTIGLRTTEVITVDSACIIIPNSNLVINKVTNWSHQREPVRFYIDVRVGYISDIEFAEQILLQSLEGQHGVLKHPAPSVQHMSFGEFSIDFRLYFYCLDFMATPVIKSNIRKRVSRNFAKNNIDIPFPQRDVWFKNLPLQNQE